MTTRLQLHSNPYIYEYKYIYIYIYIYISLYVCMYVLWHGVTLILWPPQEPTPLRFPVWLGIPKPMIPYPLLWEGAVRTVGSHLGRIPNCSEVPDTPPPPHGNPGNRPPPPPEPPSPAPLLDPPLQAPPPPPPPPLGAFGQQLVGGVVGVQDRGVAPPVKRPSDHGLRMFHAFSLHCRKAPSAVF